MVARQVCKDECLFLIEGMIVFDLTVSGNLFYFDGAASAKEGCGGHGHQNGQIVTTTEFWNLPLQSDCFEY